MLKISVTNCTRDGKPFGTADALREAYDAPSPNIETFFKPVDHSIFFTAPPQPAATTGQPMQLYCYIKQLDDVRAFMTKLGVCKYVYPLRDAAELERLCLHGQLFVNITNHHEGIPFVIRIAAENDGMHFMEITTAGEGQS